MQIILKWDGGSITMHRATVKDAIADLNLLRLEEGKEALTVEEIKVTTFPSRQMMKNFIEKHGYKPEIFMGEL